MHLRSGKYPNVLRKRPLDENIMVTKQNDVLVVLGVNKNVKVLATDVILIDDGVFYQAIMPPTTATGSTPRKRIVGLVAYDTLFSPDIAIPERLEDHQLEGCVSVAEVVDKCLPKNWRLTAEQQTEMPGYVARSISRWEELQDNGEEKEKDVRPVVHPSDVQADHE